MGNGEEGVRMEKKWHRRSGCREGVSLFQGEGKGFLEPKLQTLGS